MFSPSALMSTWQRESRCSVIATGDRVVCSAFCESQVVPIELDGLDNVELPLVREYSLNDEALDTLIQPRRLNIAIITQVTLAARSTYTYWSCAISMNRNIAIQTMDENR